ncbi:MAG TPA: hypothetical protein VFT62_05335 [Mycobacteriales bacterium]|nr:hypothetical protein [Mycobacteriales bacterium]
MRRATVALALVPVFAAPAASAYAAVATPNDPNPAPPSDTSATALKVDDLAEAGHTHAHAGSTGTTADADSLGLGGKTLVDGKTGGSTNQGNAGGSLLDTGQTPLGRLAVTPWSASANQDATGSSASSDAAVAAANVLGPKVLQVWLLHSTSNATWTSASSQSSSTSDGAEVNAGDGALDVKVLHSETNSNGKGSSSLLNINGQDVGSSDQANGGCAISVPSVLSLTCLDASGGAGSNGTSSAASDVGTLTVGSDKTPQGVLAGTSSQGGATAGTGTSGTSGDHTSVLGEKVTKTPQSGGLPFTGTNAALLSAYGAALAGIGTAITRLGRRRRRASAAA